MDVAVVGFGLVVGRRPMRRAKGFGHEGSLHGREHDGAQIDLEALNEASAARRIGSEKYMSVYTAPVRVEQDGNLRRRNPRCSPRSPHLLLRVSHDVSSVADHPPAELQQHCESSLSVGGSLSKLKCLKRPAAGSHSQTATQLED